MRKLGLIGGMSWVSTEIYYRELNLGYRRENGGLSSAPLLLESLDFARVGRIQEDEDWDEAARLLIDSAKRLEQAGAGAILICANSMHKVHDQVADAVSIPIFHIADSVGALMHANGVKTAALIGTRNVMTEPWYRQRLVKHGVSLIPPEMDRVEVIDRIIYEELMRGTVRRPSEHEVRRILTFLGQEGAEAVVFGCTELALLTDTKANVLPIYDSATCHIHSGIDWLMGREPVAR